MKYKRKKTLKKSLKRRQSYKKNKSTRKKRRGGVAPPAPALSPMDEIRSTLQQISIRPYSYENSENFINTAFDILTDFDTMVNVVSASGYTSPYDDTPLDDFFYNVIIHNFEIAVENDARHVDTIRRRLRTAQIRNIINAIQRNEGALAPREGALRPSEKIQRYMDFLATLGDDRMDVEGGKRRKNKKSTRKKSLKKKGGADSNQNNNDNNKPKPGVPPRPQLTRETPEQQRRRMAAAHAEMERENEDLLRRRELLTTNSATPLYNRVRVALFDGLHGRPEPRPPAGQPRIFEPRPPPLQFAHTPYLYVTVAIQQLSELFLVRGLQSEQISPQRTALQGILEDILTQFENLIRGGIVNAPAGQAPLLDANQVSTYNTIIRDIRSSNISRVISALQRSSSRDDIAAATLLREYIYGLLPRLDPSGPTPLQPSSTPSSLSSKKGGKRLKKK